MGCSRGGKAGAARAGCMSDQQIAQLPFMRSKSSGEASCRCSHKQPSCWDCQRMLKGTRR